MNAEFFEALDLLEKEKGISKDYMLEKIEAAFQKKKIRMVALTDYYIDDKVRNKHQFLLNYSNMDMEGLEDALGEIRQILQGNDALDKKEEL